MKNFLSLLTVATIATTSSSVVTPSLMTPQIQNQTLNSENWVWSDVKINDYVETATAGTDSESNTTNDTNATLQSWTAFSNTKQVIVDGYFAFHTYDSAIYLSNTVLNINTDKSSNTFKQWDWTKTNDVWQGWGHQTSTITLTLTAKYNDSEKLTSLEITSYIYARTASSVHECSTTSQIKTLTFVIS